MSAEVPDFEKIVTGEASEAEVEAYNEAKEAELGSSLDTHLREQSAELKAKFDIIDEAVGATEEKRTATIPFGPTEVTVYKETSGALNRKVARLGEFEGQDIESVDDHDEVVGLLIDILTGIIADDEWADRDIWQARYEARGIADLNEVAFKFVQPAQRYQEEIEQSFRERRGDSSPRGM